MTAPPAEKLIQINDAISAGDVGRAIELARATLNEGFEHALLLNLRAYWHENEGRSKEALFDLTRAAALAPDDVTILNALGLAYARVNKLTDAVKVFDGVIARRPKFWQAYYNRAWTSESAGELKAANHYFQRAAELAPEAPDPPARMAALAGRRGDWVSAQAYAERALALDPKHDVALTAMAGVEFARKDYVAAERRLSEFLADDRYLPASRATAWGVLGDVLDAQSRIAEAFDAYNARNSLLREIHQPQLSGTESVPDVLTWLNDAFTQMRPAEFAQADIREESIRGGTVGHIFMLGFPRSGTTLLEEIFASNPLIATTQERDALIDAVRDLMGKREDLALLTTLRGAGLVRQRRLYWNTIAGFGIDVRGKMLLDKQPYNTVKMPLIAKLFPGAKILFCIRDPRDVVLSCFRRRFKMSPTNFEFLTLEGTARLYDKVMRLAETYRAKLPLDLLELRHEDLVDDFERKVREVCDFVGLPWDDAMRNFAARPNRREITTPSAEQVARGLNRDGIGAWRRYEKQMAPVLPILEPWLKRYGYSPN